MSKLVKGGAKLASKVTKLVIKNAGMPELHTLWHDCAIKGSMIVIYKGIVI